MAQRFRSILLSVAFFAALASSFISPALVSADTVPPSGTPATVSDDALPTVQITGIVWAQVTVGNTVYATGRFTRARPAGAAAGVSESVRNNILAYDIRTGNLLPFNHSLNAEGKVITASPDGKRVYVGGSFTTVDGKAHGHIAAFDTATGALANFNGSTNNNISAIVANNGYVYVGGRFSSINNNVPRGHLAAFGFSGGTTTWAPSSNGYIGALILSPDESKIIIGGSFSTINGITYHGMAAVTAASPGRPLPWASQSATYPIRDEDPAGSGASITSFSKDATQIYLSAFNFTTISKPGGFEGRAAISPADGHIIWLNDCHGDSYSAYPIGNVLYSVGHPHDCQPAGAYPEVTPRVAHRALAEGITPSGVNGPATNGYTSFQGQPRSTQLDWYPVLDSGTYSGATQGAWSVTGNASYISLGGEFNHVNNKAQQGLVRFAIKTLAPNKMRPATYAAHALALTAVDASGRQSIRWHATWDPDNAILTYRMYRDGSAMPFWSTTKDSRFWLLPAMGTTTSGLAPGSAHSYKLVVSDPFGNSVTATN